MSDTTFDALAGLVRETLALEDDEPMTPGQLLFYDLGFTSMDLLDLLFRVEDHFGVTIEEGTIERLARGDLAEEEFAADGMLTAEGRRRLMKLLSDTPEEVFPESIRTSELPRFCTVAAIGRLVDHKLAAGDV